MHKVHLSLSVALLGRYKQAKGSSNGSLVHKASRATIFYGLCHHNRQHWMSSPSPARNSNATFRQNATHSKIQSIQMLSPPSIQIESHVWYGNTYSAAEAKVRASAFVSNKRNLFEHELISFDSVYLLFTWNAQSQRSGRMVYNNQSGS